MAITYDPIATTTLGSAGTSVDFNSISGTYTDLVFAIFIEIRGIISFCAEFFSQTNEMISLNKVN